MMRLKLKPITLTIAMIVIGAMCFLGMSPLTYGASKPAKIDQKSTPTSVMISGFTPSPVTVPLRFDDYYSYDMVVEALQKLHQAYPNITSLELVGKSEEGRAIYCMVINNPKTGNALEKPGIYVDGNIHGNEIQAGEVCLYVIDTLLTNYGKNKEITELVDKKCFYILPVVNVDGRYHFFADASNSDSNRSIRIPRDDDRDGLIDEDFPEDLDHDGNICVMRKKDPLGKFKTDPQEPRLMIPVKPGEKGEWTILGSEGIDHDGDGSIGEDGEGYVDANRNFGYDWLPNYAQSGAGNFPMEGVGVKAIAQFVQAHPNICMSWSFHNFSGLYLRGPSSKVDNEYPGEDVATYDYLGENAECMNPQYKYAVSWKDLYPTHGDFTEWMVHTNGCFALVGELSTPSLETFRTYEETKKIAKDEINADGEDGGFNPFSRSEKDLERLKISDNLAQGKLYVPWHPFKHPVYGDIEIGGWTKFSVRMPAPFMLKDLVHRNASAVIFSAKQTPEISMEVFEKEKIDSNLYRVRVRLSNAKAIPSMSAIAQSLNLYPKDMLTISGKQAKVVAGGRLMDIYNDTVMYKEYKPELQFLTVPGFSHVEYQYLISGSGEIEINYSSAHAGKLSKTVSLK